MRRKNPGQKTTGASPEFARDCVPEIRAALSLYATEAGQFTVLGPDPWRVVWNDARTGFVSFLEERHCVVSWRSPVAPAAEQAGLLVALRSYAQRKAVFALGVDHLVARDLETRGFHSTWVGTECHIKLTDWSVSGGRRQKVRWARSHAATLGVTWREAHPEPGSPDERSLDRVEQRWKEERRERATTSFLRNDFRELRVDRRYFVAELGGQVVASITCTPVSSESWYLQDPVRDPSAPRGALEGAMAHALDCLRDDGYTRATNGILPFWQPSDGTAAPEKSGVFITRMVGLFDRLYRFRSVNQFRSKFAPDDVVSVMVVRSQRWLTPQVVRSLTNILT